MGLLRAALRWLVDRLQLAPVVELFTQHKVPPGVDKGKTAWMYVLGFATLTALLVQIGTGIALVTKYVPSPASAYESLRHLTDAGGWGSFVRALHYFGGSAMVLLMFLHLARVYLTGSYKFPREMGWMSGVFLLVVVMGLAFTGQLLRWDENGVWTVVVASSFAGRTPWVGRELSELVLAGETIGGHTLSRFFALHVLVFPLLVAAFLGLHLYLVFRNGISEPPRAGRPVDPATYRKEYAELCEKKGAPYFPHGMWREVVFSIAVVGIIVALALVFGPKGPGGPPDPTVLRADPRPDWFVRWYYALIWVKPRALEETALVYAPVAVVLGMLVLPLVAGRGERSPSRRPWAIGLVGATVLAFLALLWLGYRAPWSPETETEPLPPEILGVSEGPVFEGSRLFVARGCQYCHRVAGRGGEYGPDLTDVTKRMSTGLIAARTLDGIRDMPAYRGAISAEELDAIVAFLGALERRRAGEAP